MGALPAGYAVRPPRTADAKAIAEVVIAADVAQYGTPEFTTVNLDDDWTRPRFDLERDAWVVTGPSGSIVAYAYLREVRPHADLEADVFVLPEYGGRGIGGSCLDLVEDRAREHRPLVTSEVTLGMYASNVNVPKRELLTQREFVPIHTMLRMAVDLSVRAPPPGRLPDGVALRQYRPATDEEPVEAMLDEVFAGQPRFAPRVMGAMLEAYVRQPGFDPSLWLVAWHGDDVIGAILASDLGDVGFVGSLGVRTSWQGRGLGLAMLRRALGALRRRGRSRVVLGVAATHAPDATRLYKRAGMHVAQRHDWFSKTL